MNPVPSVEQAKKEAAEQYRKERMMIATAAMQGMLANPMRNLDNKTNAADAIDCADKLLKLLDA